MIAKNKNQHLQHNENDFSKFAFYAGICLLLFILYSLFRTYSQYMRAKEIVLKAEEKVAEEIRKQDELKERIAKTEEIYFTEKILRDKLRMAKEDEIVIVLPSVEELRKIAPKYNEENKEMNTPNWEKWIKMFL